MKRSGFSEEQIIAILKEAGAAVRADCPLTGKRPTGMFDPLRNSLAV